MACLEAFKQPGRAFELVLWCLLGKVELVRELLDRGTSPNQRDPDGYSALHGAAENGHLEIVKLLLQRGACRDAATRDGLTPLDLAEICGQVEVAKLLGGVVAE